MYIYIFLFIILFFTGLFFYSIRDQAEDKTWFLPFLFLAVPIIIGSWWAVVTPDEDDLVFKGYQETIIHSTAGNQYKISGHFVLGTGIINSEEIYLGNVKTEYDGKTAFKRIEIPVKKTIRVIDENLSDIAIHKTPLCKFKEESYKNLPFENIYRYKEMLCPYSIKEKHPPLLMIPKDAIVQQINFQ